MQYFQLSPAGGRLIISSDGVWDMLSFEAALDCCRGLSTEAAAAQIVKVCLLNTIAFLRILVFHLAFVMMVSLHLLFHLQEAVQVKGLRDDTTCIVVDILPPEKNPPPLPPPKKTGKRVLKAMFKKKSSESCSNIEKEYLGPDVVEEMYEEGSACLTERSFLLLLPFSVILLP